MVGKTFAIRIVDEHTGNVAFEHVGIPETQMRKFAQLCSDYGPEVRVAAAAARTFRAVDEAAKGLAEALHGLSRASKRRKAPAARVSRRA